jgi:hypothetical protein
MAPCPWVGRYRRLVRDYQRRFDVSAAMIHLPSAAGLCAESPQPRHSQTNFDLSSSGSGQGVSLFFALLEGAVTEKPQTFHYSVTVIGHYSAQAWQRA